MKQYNERNCKRKGQTQVSVEIDLKKDQPKSSDGEIKNELNLEPAGEEEEDEPESSNISSDSSVIASDDDRDKDFIIVRANERPKAKLKTKKTSIKIEQSSPASTAMFICDYCDQHFKAKQGLSRHVQSHIENSVPWKCSENVNSLECEFAASSKLKLIAHKFEAHGIEPKITNPPSPPAVKIEKIEKKEKVKIETRGGDYKCFCGVSFTNARSLCAHKK